MGEQHPYKVTVGGSSPSSPNPRKEGTHAGGINGSSFTRDWNFYIKNLGKLTFWGGRTIPVPPYSKDGVSGKECVYSFESVGVLLPCREPELFEEVIKFKKSLGFHIKMWSEGFHDMCMSIDEYLDVLEDVPDWVRKSFKNQVLKYRYCKKIS